MDARCDWCRDPLSPEDARPVPASMRFFVALAMALMHGGLWAMRELSLPYCARCRARIARLSALVAATVFLLAAAIGTWWIRRVILGWRSV